LSRLYLSAGKARQQLITESHDIPTGGHLNVHKAHEKLHRHFYWPRLFDSVNNYINTCITCQRIKPPTKTPLGNLYPLPIPDRCWEEVSHDLITSLPRTPRGYDAIVTLVDRLSKRDIFAPRQGNITAEGYENIIFQQVFRHFGLPKRLISDRNLRFTTQFWQSHFDHLGTSLKISSSRCPETNGPN